MSQLKFDFTDKVAIITGGASGIGMGTVLAFLDAGASVVALDLSTESITNLEKITVQKGQGERLRTVHGDATSSEDIAKMVKVAEDDFGGLDYAFLNAGAGGAVGPLEHLDPVYVDRTLNLLLTSCFVGLKHCVPALRSRGGGVITMTSSISGIAGGGAPHVYSAAKAGVVSVARTAAVELGKDNIRVNAVIPGYINTPLISNFNEDEDTPDIAEVQPIARDGQPADIANQVLFLSSDNAGYITGAGMLVDGGIIAKGPAVIPPHGLDGFAGYSPGNTGEEIEGHEI